MSKTLASVLEIGALVAVQAIPGVGQVIGGAIGGALFGAVTANTAVAIASIAVVGISAITNALLGGGSSKPATTENSIKSPLPPRVSAYGSVRLQGAYDLFDTSSSGWACDSWVYHDGQIDGLIDTYLGDRKVTRISRSGAGFGWIEHQEAGLFGDKDDCIQVEVNLGLPTETAFSSLLYQIPDHWTAAHRGDGCVTASMISKPVKSKDFATVYATGGPDRTPVSLAMRAQLVFDWRDEAQDIADPATWKWSENDWLHIAHYLLVRMKKNWALHFVPTIAMWTAAADDADSRIALKAVQTILAGSADSGSTSLNVYATTGLSAGMTVSVFISGDNSKTETRTVTSVGANAIGFSGGLSYDHPQGSQVTWASDPSSPATEPRYRGCVTHSHTDAHKDVLAKLLGCCDGWLAPRSDGALVPYSGRYYAPDPADGLGPNEIIEYSIQNGVNEEDAINTLKVTYVSANHDFNTVDTDDWTDDDDITARGKQLSDSLQVEIPSHSQGRRLAKRKMARVMAPFRGTTTTNAAGRKILGKRFVWQHIAEAGTVFFDGPVEVVKVVRNLGTGGVTFDWISADPNIDAWNPATEEGDPAPVGNRVVAGPLAPPVVVSVTPTYGQNTAYGVPGVKLTIVAQGPDRDDITWFVRTRPTGDVSWLQQEYSDVDPGASVALQTDFLPLADLDVEISYSTGDGRVSPWATLDDDPINTGMVLPAAITGLSVSSNADFTLITADWADTMYATRYLVEIIPEPA